MYLLRSIVFEKNLIFNLTKSGDFLILVFLITKNRTKDTLLTDIFQKLLNVENKTKYILIELNKVYSKSDYLLLKILQMIK